MSVTNPVDGYFALLNVSAEGIQHSLTASVYTLQAEVIWTVAVLVAIILAVHALTRRTYAERAERRERSVDRELRQLLWDLLLRDAERLTVYRFTDHQPHTQPHTQHKAQCKAEHQDKGNAA